MSKGKGKNAKKATKQQGYLLTHDKLGVLLGFLELPVDNESGTLEMPIFSNFEAGGRQEALILRADLRLYTLIDRITQQTREFGPEGFRLLPVKCKQGELYLPMEKCVKLGLPKWYEYPPHWGSESRH